MCPRIFERWSYDKELNENLKKELKLDSFVNVSIDSTILLK